MIYNYQSLLSAVADLGYENLESDHARHLGHLLHIWANAYKTAPSEIIGVGLITYSENALIAYQEQQQNTESK